MKLGEAAICKTDDVTYRELDGEGILYNSKDKNMHVLNQTALTVWNLCDTAEDAKQIADIIADQYRMPVDIVFADVLKCLTNFEKLGLIRRVSY
ncbi:MAG: PqqD family protein [Armatimonadota bacterium]